MQARLHQELLVKGLIFLEAVLVEDFRNKAVSLATMVKTDSNRLLGRVIVNPVLSSTFLRLPQSKSSPQTAEIRRPLEVAQINRLTIL